MGGDRDVVALIAVREHEGRTYEVRLAIYGSGGSLLKEEVYSGVRSISIDADIDIIKIGYRELHLLSRGETTISMDNNTKKITISRKNKDIASSTQGGGNVC